MKVSLVNYTGNAKELLILSKNTRHLDQIDADNPLKEILEMDEKKKAIELEYVLNTVGSALEFVDYTFLIKGVTRAFTHQLVRHRVGTSFAQQSLRLEKTGNFEYRADGNAVNSTHYAATMANIRDEYTTMIRDENVDPQDARGILPTNILTNILFKANLRSISDIISNRLCIRTQKEFREAAKKMADLIIQIHPWAKKLFDVICIKTFNCPWKNFHDCPMKSTYNNVLSVFRDQDGIKRMMRKDFDRFSENNFQPEVKK